MKKLSLLPIYFLISGFLIAQEKQSFKVSFDHVALSVKNVNVSADFYKEILSLEEIVNRGKADGIRWFSLSDGKELHLISIVEGEITINKAVHFALRVTDFEALTNRLKKLKMDYSSWSGEKNKITVRADGIKQVYIQDPDGYWIEINSAKQ